MIERDADIICTSSAVPSGGLVVVSHTLPGGHDRLLTVGVVLTNSGTAAPPDQPEPTWAGERMVSHPLVASSVSPNRKARLDLFTLVAPKQGTQEFVMPLTGLSGQPIVAILLRSYKRVDQQDPVRDWAGVARSSAPANTPVTVMVAADAADLVIDIAHGAGPSDDTQVTEPGQIKECSVVASDSIRNAMSSKQGACDTTTMGWKDQVIGVQYVWGVVAMCLRAAAPRCYAPGDAVPTHCPPDLDDPPGADQYVPWYP